MYSKKRGDFPKKALLFLPTLLILPIVILFDSLMYMITRPSCMSCGSLTEFLKTASLSVFLLANTGYKFQTKK
ncbi:hypothetical protein A2774_03370 [Candidatus Roizmanbacteria bacterium RIFCSPHIGHO2_01_FULL_39_12c]|uniref:Uncharacterized protein n=1 Tax=Candidatus Roizmanbacteria bacterium RIFCSPHIGHO2_01_FULL_39_12c TaxID=1802031 RepID=A0A1F7G932_9BACT|nr:MAG: hypothetical protein A2774_03370 [Candidatus Roizmanbacteria bacterium RIFCSPHIGHO2_01_FULL_39_12c]OGK47856.1 MAG: hypothetical protein A2963_03315 [Candidatus Roizmanbacteria bacterium RIFCSPLOWO2_01_FULL_40_13]